MRSNSPAEWPNLPAQLTPFVGRTQELAEIATLLNDPICRLVTLVGPGGIGKTRLAIEIATQMTTYPDDVYFVALQSLSSPDFIVFAIASALNFQFYPGTDPKQQLLDYLREKHLLLILDNFEHLLDGVNLISALLAYAPGIKLLATSRERLQLTGETIFAITGMDFPDWETPVNVLDFTAVKLFMQGAKRVHPHFTLANQDLKQLARICQLVGGMPLAILMAAAWVEVLPLHIIADQISHNLDFLETEFRDLPERQRNVRATFDYSWHRLSDIERNVFKKLSVFCGGFTQEGAGKVAGASIKSLMVLVNKSLIQVKSDRRFDLHPLLRQYAEDQLNQFPLEREAVHNLHCEYYLDFMCQRENDLIRAETQDSQRDSFRKTLEESDNLRAVLWRKINQGQIQEISSCWDSFFNFCEMQHWFQEGQNICQAILVQLQSGFAGSEMERNRLWVLSLSWQIWFLWRLARITEAKTYIDELMPFLSTSVNGSELAGVLERLGGATPDYEAAKQLLQEAIVFGKAHDQLWWVASAAHTLTQHALSREEYQDARWLANEALAICRQINDQIIKVFILLDLSNIAAVAHDLILARQYAEEASMTAELFGYQWAILRTTLNRGDIALAQKDYVEASIAYERSLILAQNLGLRWYSGFIFMGLGDLALQLEKYQDAQRYYLQALSASENTPIMRQPQFADLMPRVLAKIVRLWIKIGKKEAANELIALIHHHPTSSPTLKRDLEYVQDKLQAELPPTVYQTSLERGEQLDLDSVVTELLQELLSMSTHPDPQSQNPFLDANRSLIDPLTERELEVLHLIAAGQSNSEMAQHLFIGISTVKKHINHIFSKLDVKTREASLSRARELNLI